MERNMWFFRLTLWSNTSNARMILTLNRSGDRSNFEIARLFFSYAYRIFHRFANTLLEKKLERVEQKRNATGSILSLSRRNANKAKVAFVTRRSIGSRELIRTSPLSIDRLLKLISQSVGTSEPVLSRLIFGKKKETRPKRGPSVGPWNAIPSPRKQVCESATFRTGFAQVKRIDARTKATVSFETLLQANIFDCSSRHRTEKYRWKLVELWTQSKIRKKKSDIRKQEKKEMKKVAWMDSPMEERVRRWT